MYVTAIDFETAWYKPESAIAVGISRIHDGRVIETRSWLFRPPGKSIYIRPEFIDIHGISPDDLRGKPRFDGAWPEIAPYLESASMLLAHNARFDRSVLHATAEHYGILLPQFDWLCTVNLSRATWPKLANHKLNTVSAHLDIALNHHDAASDAQACANIYIHACEAQKNAGNQAAAAV
ncbi:MAG: 3'-5' exonuclease [Micavibrio sp.]|nr:3'-5' exonuclease [Micavibrio sp.]